MSRRIGVAMSVSADTGYTPSMNATILWIIAAILVIVGIVQLLQGQIILGIVLIVVGLLVGPGGHSIFNSRRA
jgi:TM2 domain-containing membrane protein YozV